jgi:hypothetical protein
VRSDVTKHPGNSYTRAHKPLRSKELKNSNVKLENQICCSMAFVPLSRIFNYFIWSNWTLVLKQKNDPFYLFTRNSNSIKTFEFRRYLFWRFP